MDAHIRHLMAYKSFIEHTNTLVHISMLGHILWIVCRFGEEHIEQSTEYVWKERRIKRKRVRKTWILGQVEKEKLNENFLPDMIYESKQASSVRVNQEKKKERKFERDRIRSHNLQSDVMTDESW